MIAVGLVSSVGLSSAQAAQSATFGYTGAPALLDVPTGVQTIRASATGAAGADGVGKDAGTRGLGGSASAVFPVDSSVDLKIRVGGAGSGLTGGFNGGGNGGTGSSAGGGGGGASDVTAGGQLLITAPGGGGGGGNGSAKTGGNGGAGTKDGESGVAGTNQGSSGRGKGGAAAQVAGGTATPGTAGARGNAQLYSGGGGGGGGGGYLAGNGGAGGSGGDFSTGGGGGGGAGNAFISDSGTQASFGSGGTGNGSVSLSWVEVATDGLPDGRATNVYGPIQLAAAGGSGAYSWTLSDPSALPSGMTFDDATGTLAGTPSAETTTVLDFIVNDGAGLTATASLPLDILAADAVVGDSPATGISITSATGNGTVWPSGGTAADVTSVACMLSTSSNMASAVSVPVNQTMPLSSTTNVSCPFTGLTADTQYYFTLVAVQGGVSHETGQPQSFETLARAEQSFKPKFPKNIKFAGITKLLGAGSKTNNGTPVRVKLSKSNRKAYDSRGDLRLFKKIVTKKGKVSVKTFGNKFYLKITYVAKGSATVAPFKTQRVYRVAKLKTR